MKLYNERLEYQKEYQKRYREQHREELNRKQRKYKRIKDKELKAEMKKIKKEMKYTKEKKEIIAKIDEFTYENSNSKNKAVLFKNKDGKWYYEIFFADKTTYVSGLFENKVKAYQDIKVAI